MRDIEFRGKRIDNGEWIYGYLVISNHRLNKGKHYILPDVADFSYGDDGNRIRIGCFVEVNSNTVGQYTGLKDKNGVKIYEGDVVHYDATPYNAYGLDVVGEIVSHKFSWKMIYQKYDMTNFYPIGSEDFFGAKSEVIGNIHDNPELL